jgi:hypothetical protein
MTEAEWFACSEPAYLAANVPFSPRKHRLFAVACCWRGVHLIHNITLRHATEVAERFADGGCTEAEFAACESRVRQVTEEMKRLDPATNSVVLRGDFVYPETYAAEMVGCCLVPDSRSAARDVPFFAASAAAGTPYEHEPPFQVEFAAQAELVRDIFGNPFRTVAFAPAWRTPRPLPSRRGCTSRGTSVRCRSWRTRSRTRGATATTSSTTAATRSRSTSAGAGSSISCWGRCDRRAEGPRSLAPHGERSFRSQSHSPRQPRGRALG